MLQVTPRESPPMFQSPPVVLGLIGVLILIHAALQYGGSDWQVWSLEAAAFIPARYGSASYPVIPGSQVWSFLTYAFLHGSWPHVLFNCLWLLIFGTVVARYMGALRFLLLAAVAAIAGAFCTLALHWGEDTIMVGASGAISGMMAAAVPIMYGRRRFFAGGNIGDPHSALPLSPRELFGNRGAVIFMVVLLAITLFSGATGFTGNSFSAATGIAWEAHVGGFLGGLVSFYLLRNGRVRG